MCLDIVSIVIMNTYIARVGLLIKRKNHLQTVAAYERFVKSIHVEKLVYYTKLYPNDVISTEVVTVSDLDA
jgi:hypothetical protein